MNIKLGLQIITTSKILLYGCSILFLPYFCISFLLPFLNIDTAYYSIMGEAYTKNFNINEVPFDHKPFGIIFYGVLIHLLGEYHTQIISVCLMLFISLGFTRLDNINFIPKKFLVFLIFLFGIHFEGMSANTEIIISTLIFWLLILCIETYNKPNLYKTAASGFFAALAISINLLSLPVLTFLLIGLIIHLSDKNKIIKELLKIIFITIGTLCIFIFFLFESIESFEKYINLKRIFLDNYASSYTLFDSIKIFIDKIIYFSPILIGSILLGKIDNIFYKLFFYWFLGASLSIILAKNGFDHYYYLLAIPLIGSSLAILKNQNLTLSILITIFLPILILTFLKSINSTISLYSFNKFIKNDYQSILTMINDNKVHDSQYAFIEINPDIIYFSKLDADNNYYFYYGNENNHLRLLNSDINLVNSFYYDLLNQKYDYLLINKDFCNRALNNKICSKIIDFEEIASSSSISLLSSKSE